MRILGPAVQRPMVVQIRLTPPHVIATAVWESRVQMCLTDAHV